MRRTSNAGEATVVASATPNHAGVNEKVQLNYERLYHNTKLSYDLAPQKESPFYLVDYQLSVAPKSKSSIKLTVKIHLAVDRCFSY